MKKVIVGIGALLLVLGAIFLFTNKPVQSSTQEQDQPELVQETEPTELVEPVESIKPIEEKPLATEYKKDPSQSYEAPVGGGKNDTDGPGEFQPEEPKCYDYPESNF